MPRFVDIEDYEEETNYTKRGYSVNNTMQLAGTYADKPCFLSASNFSL